jgi:hypothetical protein
MISAAIGMPIPVVSVIVSAAVPPVAMTPVAVARVGRLVPALGARGTRTAGGRLEASAVAGHCG